MQNEDQWYTRWECLLFSDIKENATNLHFAYVCHINF